MGRGRQKAKHTKVARELKYFSPDTNLSALQRELAVKRDVSDPWAEHADNNNSEVELPSEYEDTYGSEYEDKYADTYGSEYEDTYDSDTDGASATK